jgi:hypothetical protein
VSCSLVYLLVLLFLSLIMFVSNTYATFRGNKIEQNSPIYELQHPLKKVWKQMTLPLSTN